MEKYGRNYNQASYKGCVMDLLLEMKGILTVDKDFSTYDDEFLSIKIGTINLFEWAFENNYKVLRMSVTDEKGTEVIEGYSCAYEGYCYSSWTHGSDDWTMDESKPNEEYNVQTVFDFLVQFKDKEVLLKIEGRDLTEEELSYED